MHLRTRQCQLIMLCFITFLAGGLASCDTSGDPPSEYSNFQTVVASAKNDGYVPYWLGTTFTAGGLVFTGPNVGDFGFEVPGGGLSYDYRATAAGDAPVNLEVVLYSKAGWDQAKANQGGPQARSRS